MFVPVTYDTCSGPYTKKMAVEVRTLYGKRMLSLSRVHKSKI